MRVEKLSDQGQDLYLRVDAAEFGKIIPPTVFFVLNLIKLGCSLNFFELVASYQQTPIITKKAKESLVKRG